MSNLLKRAERIPVLNGYFPVNKLDQDRSVASAVEIVFEKYVPVFSNKSIFGFLQVGFVFAAPEDRLAFPWLTNRHILGN